MNNNRHRGNDLNESNRVGNCIHCDNKLRNQSKLEAEATGACLGLNFDITPFQCKFRLNAPVKEPTDLSGFW